jgi:Activator of Hsp90 ATPase homolog 1-like protein
VYPGAGSVGQSDEERDDRVGRAVEPGKLVHTYQRGDVPGDPPTTVSYSVEPVGNGTRITLRHSAFTSREVCLNNCLGWETSFAELAALLAPGATGDTAAGNAESSD